MIQARALLLGMAAAAAFGAAAQAADPPGTWGPGPFSYQRPEPRFVEMASGWYIRGDLGYRMNHIGSVDAANPITNSKYDPSLGITFGGGYKDRWFRTDVTVDYGQRVTMRADSSLAGAAQPQYTNKLETVSLLGNVYIDLGTWWGFTPYIGGGAGVSYLRSREYTDTTLPVNFATPNGRTNFSWAAMAGISYRISARWMVDVGYRHLDLGDLPATTGTNLATDQTRWRGLSTDEVRLGFRFLLD